MAGDALNGLPHKYSRDGWFGPESFFAVVLGMICMSLPYAGLAPNDADWLVVSPLLIGAALITLSITGIPRSNRLRRCGVGFLCAFAGFVLGAIALLLGIGAGAVVS